MKSKTIEIEEVIDGAKSVRMFRRQTDALLRFYEGEILRLHGYTENDEEAAFLRAVIYGADYTIAMNKLMAFKRTKHDSA